MTTTTKTGFSDSWTKRTSKHCANTKHGSAFSTLTAAQDFCLQQGPSACSGVYDDGCDGKGSFYACKVGAFDSSSIGSCIYTAAKNGWFRVKYCALYCMNVADDRIGIWGEVGVAFTATLSKNYLRLRAFSHSGVMTTPRTTSMKGVFGVM